RQPCFPGSLGAADDTEGLRRRRGILAGSPLLATWKDGPDGLLESPAARASVGGTGRCEPRALYLALWPAASTWGEPVATTPRAAGSLRSRRCLAGAFGAAQATQGPEREQHHEREPGGVCQSDLGRVPGEESASRLDDSCQRVVRGDAVNPALQ